MIPLNLIRINHFILLPLSRSSSPEEFCKRGVLRNLQNVQKNIYARASFLLKKRLRHRCFPVNFAKFRRTSFVTEHLIWLLLFILDTRSLSLFTHFKTTLDKAISLCYDSNVKFVFIVETLVEIILHGKVE